MRMAAQAVRSYCRYKTHKASVHRVRALHCGQSASTGLDVSPFVQWEVPPPQRACSLDFAQATHLVHQTAQKHPRPIVPKYPLGQIDRKNRSRPIGPPTRAHPLGTWMEWCARSGMCARPKGAAVWVAGQAPSDVVYSCDATASASTASSSL